MLYDRFYLFTYDKVSWAEWVLDSNFPRWIYYRVYHTDNWENWIQRKFQMSPVYDTYI